MFEDINAFEWDRELLTDEIAVAFRDVSRGDGITLHEAQIIDGCGTLNVDRSDDEFQAARMLDSEQSWNDVPASVIEDLYSVLGFLDAHGFRFYIPAYMVWTLQNYRSSDSATSSSTIHALDLGVTAEEWKWNQPRFQLLSEQQRSVILSFLSFMSRYGDDFDREIALECSTNWQKYLRLFAAHE